MSEPDVPKIHDVAEHVATEAALREIGVTSDELRDLQVVSASLARRRAPAFYFEQDEDATAANEAANDARRIHGLCTRVIADIGV